MKMDSFDNEIALPKESVYKCLFEIYPFDDAVNMCINIARQEIMADIDFRIFWDNIDNNGYILYDTSNV